jgi:hypothetical protein
MESLYMTSATSLKLNLTSQSTLMMGSLYMNSLISPQFCINQEEQKSVPGC